MNDSEQFNQLIDNKEARTFETRLQFINNLFAHKYSKTDILISCVEHKLKMSYEQYLEDLKWSMSALETQDPAKVLKKMK